MLAWDTGFRAEPKAQACRHSQNHLCQEDTGPDRLATRAHVLQAMTLSALGRFLLLPCGRDIESRLLLAVAAISAAVLAAGWTAVAPATRSTSSLDCLEMRGLCNGCHGQNEAERK